MVPWGNAWGENPQDPHRCRRVVDLERELAQARAEHANAETQLGRAAFGLGVAR